jgi:NAD(P)-dependent dehydrogenase (short-subunit alcohol dehydrogenase family)
MYIDKIFNLKNKVAVVIGGGGHLCSAMSKAYARAGCKVAILDLRVEKAEEIKSQLENEGLTDVIALALDATDKNNHIDALQTIKDVYGQVDILINGAGINAPTPFLKISIEEWQAVMDSQITATMWGCQVFGSHMLDNNSGTIINISSASAGPPLSKAFTYSVAKAGIKNLTQNLAREWATEGVRVNAIRPGFFPTEWNRKNFITPERESAILGHTPMARYGEPDELAGAVLWLGSDASAFVTGAEITVDGGFSCMTI